MVKNLQMGRSACFFAVENNKISALVYAQTESPINGKEGTEKWILNLLAVLPECQGRGIGKKLVTKVEEIAKKKGAKKIFVTTNELDRPVQLFYERLGYKFAGRVQDYQYGLNNSALFFLKQL
jgi:ribosomal protein S18 acetylase RimI-like enzyme